MLELLAVTSDQYLFIRWQLLNLHRQHPESSPIVRWFARGSHSTWWAYRPLFRNRACAVQLTSGLPMWTNNCVLYTTHRARSDTRPAVVAAPCMPSAIDDDRQIHLVQRLDAECRQAKRAVLLCCMAGLNVRAPLRAVVCRLRLRLPVISSPSLTQRGAHSDYYRALGLRLQKCEDFWFNAWRPTGIAAPSFVSCGTQLT